MDMRTGQDARRFFRQLFIAGTEVAPRRAKERSIPFAGHSRLMERTGEALRKTHSYYKAQQHSDGYWWFELESNVTITAEYLMLLHLLGLQDGERDAKIANHLLRHQRADGTWPIHWNGKGDLSTSIEAYFALKLSGLSPEAPSMRRARDFILDQGGVEASRVFTRIFLALFGEFDWRAIPSLPVEINLLPSWFPLTIYDFSSWARSTLVPLSLLLDLKPVRPLPTGKGVRELYREPHAIPPLTTQKMSPLSWKRFFVLLDRVIKAAEERPLRPMRERARRATEEWILEHQEPTGDWGGIQPAMVNSVLALVARGYDLSHDAVERGLKALENFTIEREGELMLQSCISPVWDTALTALSLFSSGMEKGHPALVRASAWLATKQIFRKGDWSIKRPDLAPGGWAFELENSWYPDVDDTAVVLMFLNRYAGENSVSAQNVERGLRWILGMQGRDGGWGAFDVDNTMRILNQLPFGDLEAMIDPGTPDLTGRVLELLGQMKYPSGSDTVRKAIRFLKKRQEKDGSWWGRWGVNYLYGTSSVLSGLHSIGEDMSGSYVRKAVEWIKGVQNADGGWGECCESYSDPALKCRGMSTPSQTAWAVLALIAGGEGTGAEAVKGIQYLLERQGEDGTWQEESFTGTGFPKYFMIRYHNYRNCFPLMALGKFRSLLLEKGKMR
ncbi:MAG: squalene--hopene cyclase [Nitrospirales bacterium]|nr:squalene--hopene cyclase [Nitrospirales bacterium]